MPRLLEQVQGSIEARRLLTRGQRVLVAVSGGVDSMVLLHVLAELAQQYRWKITVAHFNHRLRGSSSLADERLVERTARQLNLPFLVSRADVRGYAHKHKLSIEMAARQLRHDFLARAARQRRISRIALAHHLDDQVELFFLRLFRGTGIQGLAGMKWRNRSPANPKIDLVRPLLDVSKSELLQFARERRVPFRHDATNDNLDIQRNRVRQELLPLLERKYQPELRSKIFRLMDVLGAESAFVDSVAQAWLGAHSGCEGTLVRASVRQNGAADRALDSTRLGLAGLPFDALPVAIQRRCLQCQIVHLGIHPSYYLVERLRLRPEKAVAINRQVPPERPRKAASSSELSSSAAACGLVRDMSGAIRLVSPEVRTFQTGSQAIDLRKGKGRVKWDGLELRWQISPGAGSKLPGHERGTECFDADAVGAAVTIRHWQAGDRFAPIGMTRSVKLQDLFVNQKVPRGTRHRLLIATTAGGEIFWVEGLRVSERFKLTKGTIRRLLWRWQRL